MLYMCVYIYIYIHIFMKGHSEVEREGTILGFETPASKCRISNLRRATVGRNRLSSAASAVFGVAVGMSGVSRTNNYLIWVALLVQRYLSNTASFVLCTVYSAKDHHHLLHNLQLLKKTCVRQVVLDKSGVLLLLLLICTITITITITLTIIIISICIIVIIIIISISIDKWFPLI